MAMTNKKQVLKLDGSIEVFDPQKIKRVVCAAGLTNEQGEKLIATVSDFIYSMGENPVSSEIIIEKDWEFSVIPAAALCLSPK